jgi:hypothetical protein
LIFGWKRRFGDDKRRTWTITPITPSSDDKPKRFHNRNEREQWK